jgi:hypothetical protein
VPLGTPWVIDAASTADYRHDKGVACLVEIPYHRHAAEAAVEQEQTRADPGLPDQVQQALEHLDHRGTVLNANQGHGKALSPTHDIGAGIGMKVGRTAFGLAPVNLGGLLMGLAVVRDQGQVDGHALGPLAQAFGELSREQSIHSLFQRYRVRTQRRERVAHRLIAGSGAQLATGSKHRTQVASGIKQHLQQRLYRALGAVILPLQVRP